MTLNKIVEALIFASQDPLSTKAIAKIVRRIAAREEASEELQGTKKKHVDRQPHDRVAAADALAVLPWSRS